MTHWLHSRLGTTFAATNITSSKVELQSIFNSIQPEILDSIRYFGIILV